MKQQIVTRCLGSTKKSNFWTMKKESFDSYHIDNRLPHVKQIKSPRATTFVSWGFKTKAVLQNGKPIEWYSEKLQSLLFFTENCFE